MNPDAEGPVIHYHMVRGGQKRNITVLETGTIGGEYIKTYGHYHIGELTKRTGSREGVALLQKLADQSDPFVVAEFKAIQVKAGDSVYMPAGYGHLMLNTGKTWLVMEDDSPVEVPTIRPQCRGTRTTGANKCAASRTTSWNVTANRRSCPISCTKRSKDGFRRSAHRRKLTMYIVADIGGRNPYRGSPDMESFSKPVIYETPKSMRTQSNFSHGSADCRGGSVVKGAVVGKPKPL